MVRSCCNERKHDREVAQEAEDHSKTTSTRTRLLRIQRCRRSVTGVSYIRRAPIPPTSLHVPRFLLCAEGSCVLVRREEDRERRRSQWSGSCRRSPGPSRTQRTSSVPALLFLRFVSFLSLDDPTSTSAILRPSSPATDIAKRLATLTSTPRRQKNGRTAVAGRLWRTEKGGGEAKGALLTFGTRDALVQSGW